ncbi:MAG TPA: GTP-binding protein [Conexivisphaerales archaeon]|nr:GTP-binding protein [Conexivisphaerales archaeon]
MNGPRKAVILGAAGRDFHNFNVFFRDNPAYEVVAFTATQIPYISSRTYPPSLSGPRYPKGVKIVPEGELASLISEAGVDDVFFSYSDVTHEQVMHLASISLASGASFHLLGPNDTMLKSRRPVVSIVGSRTGVGKSTISRHVFKVLSGEGWKPVVVRHPMPYGNFEKGVERYATVDDVVKSGITVEEMEEYEQHVEQGGVIFSGVDYGAILKQAEAEGDLVMWDGGNNDMSFYRPDLNIVVLDPTRPGQEDKYHPGETNVRMADVIVVNKVNVVARGDTDKTIAEAKKLNPGAEVVLTESVETIDKPELVRGKEVLVVEDGPSVTHGGLSEAVGARAARLFGARLVDPRDYSVGSIREAYLKFRQMGPVMPSLGYSKEQLRDLEESINRVPCDTVLLGTPANLSLVLHIDKPVARVGFAARDASVPSLTDVIKRHAASFERS